MYYEINVSLNGKHFFATAHRSITDNVTLKEVLPVFVAKFPASEGYLVTVCMYETTGKYLSVSEICDSIPATQQEFKIYNERFKVASLSAIYTPEIAQLVDEYINDQNCWPVLWIEDNKALTTEQKACFIYHCLNHYQFIGAQINH